MELENFSRSDVFLVKITSEQDVYDNADLSEWAKQNGTIFLTAIFLLILFVVANIIFFIFYPKSIIAIFTLLFFFNFSIISFFVCSRKKWKSKTTLEKDKTIINMADHIVKS